MTEMEWQPIETAPKDGSEIDLYGSVAYGDGDIYYGRFPSCVWGKLYGGGWNWLYEGLCPKDMTITHWMPLPQPPVIFTDVETQTFDWAIADVVKRFR